MREDLIKRANKAYEKLQNDPQAWQEELEERADWDSTIADGLEPLDKEYLQALDTTLNEWQSENDNHTYEHLQDL